MGNVFIILFGGKQATLTLFLSAYTHYHPSKQTVPAAASRWDTSSFACHVLMHRPRKPRVSDATQEIHAKIVAKPSGSRASLPKKPAATNTTKMSSTLDHMPVPHLKPLRSHSLRPFPRTPNNYIVP